MIKKTINNSYIYFNKEIYNFFEILKTNNFKIIKILKNDKRSLVKIISIKNNFYILKIPKEKNNRKWQRFLSLFRGSESYREFKNLEKIFKLGFYSPKPLFVLEEKKWGMTFKSLLISEFIKGRESSINEIDLVSEVLKDIHKKGFLHGDSQLSNFMIFKNKIFLIDSKFSKNYWGKFGAIYEFIYLEESCGENLKNYYNKNDFYYKISKILNSYLHFWGKIRKISKIKFWKGKSL